MIEDWLSRVLRRFGRPDVPLTDSHTLHEIDDRLDAVAREQAEIDARLHLLERQADPRGIRRQQ